jgi:hypothetical protein
VDGETATKKIKISTVRIDQLDQSNVVLIEVHKCVFSFVKNSWSPANFL